MLMMKHALHTMYYYAEKEVQASSLVSGLWNNLEPRQSCLTHDNLLK